MQISNIKLKKPQRGDKLWDSPFTRELKFGTRKIMAQIKLWCRISLSEAVKALNVLLKPGERLEQMRLFFKATGPRASLATCGKLASLLLPRGRDYRLAKLKGISNMQISNFKYIWKRRWVFHLKSNRKSAFRLYGFSKEFAADFLLATRNQSLLYKQRLASVLNKCGYTTAQKQTGLRASLATCGKLASLLLPRERDYRLAKLKGISNMQISNTQKEDKYIHTRINKLICLFAYLLIFAFAAPQARAQDISFGIYPPISQIEAKAPADIKSPIFIENPGDFPIELNISYKAFIPAQSEDGKVEFLDNFESLPDPLITKKVFIIDGVNQITSLTLSPKQKKNLIMEIILPAKQPKGDYYFSVIFSSAAQSADASNISLQTGAISMNILLTVGPKGKTNGVLENFSAPLFVDSGPVAFNVAVKNTGNHFIQPEGEIIIKNMFGQAVGKVPLLQVNILSDSTRRIPDTLQLTTDEVQYEKIKRVVEKNTFPVAIWPEKFLLGPYTATLTLSLSDDGPVFKKSAGFFAFPVSLILAILIVVSITIFVILRVRQKIE